MSKSPKSIRQGDERNLYQRRLKATNAPLKHADPNDRLTVKQSDSTRPSIVGTSQRSNAPLGKNFKSKLTSPIKQKALKSNKVSNHLYLQTLKVKQSSIDHLKVRTMKVQHQDGGDSAVSHSKGLKKEMPKNKNKSEETVDKDREKKIENNQVDESIASNTNGKAPESELEEQNHAENNMSKESKDKGENDTTTEVRITKDVKHEEDVVIVADPKNSNGKEEENKPEEKNSPITFVEPKVEIEIMNLNEKIESERQSIPVSQEEDSSNKSKNEECLSGSDVVESTTSEPTIEQQLEPQKNQEGLQDPNASMTENFKDQSFGRTLRGISGRTSLGRLRNITVRERRMSPNDSLFVNTSRISVSQERSIYGEHFDSPLFNSSRLERKRKRVADTEPSTKKVKVDEGYNFLNFSWNYLKYWRRPEQVPASNTNELNLNLDNKTNIDDSTININETTEPKKWCIIM
ncbi:uncharacterized protein [Chelonus insularis]|uniref:uncharacterized protein isoform X2 n=1 Tax=Chelonus insularis TaxID=460826 RepID=UPI00158E3437|nr:uncharacterized protein LOC118072794 isoform X2 [Chelonus insularis]